MRISMIPSNDVKTIHASQNDTQRQWSFEPFDNSGTLIIGEESLANITRIKGNTLAFNQLVQNGNFANTNNWLGSVTSFTVSNNKATVVCGQWRGINQVVPCVPNHKYLLMATCKQSGTTLAPMIMRKRKQNTSQYVDASVPITQTQSTLSIVSTTESDATTIQVLFQNNATDEKTIEISNAMLIDLTLLNASYITDYNSFKSYFPLPYYSYQSTLLPFKGTSIKTVGKNQFDAQLVTPTGGGADIVLYRTEGTVRAVYTGSGRYMGFNYYALPLLTDTFLKGKYRLSFDISGIDTQWSIGLRKGASFVGTQTTAPTRDGHYSITLDFDANPECYLSFSRTGNLTTPYDITFSNIQLELGTTETEYIPYAESTTDLPTLTYFPNGMNGFDDVYDELLPTKATTRFVKYTITGTESVYEWSQGYNNHYGGSLTLPSSISRICKGGTNTNGIASRGYNVAFANNNMTVYLNTNADRIIIINDAYTTQAQWLQGITGLEVVLELATPIETDINTEVFYPVYQYGTEQILPINGANPTTSPFVGDIYYADGLKTDQTFLYRQTPINYNTRQFALVSKNTETPLTLKDGKGYCNSPLALTNESGFFDAKLKMTDSDGVCYSEKFQIHVERRP